MTSSEAAYVVGVGHADRLLAQGLPVLGVSPMDAGSKFAISFAASETRRTALRWPVETPYETVEADVRATLEDAK